MITAADLGGACSATFGGWFTASLVGLAAPMVLLDIVATYPTLFRLLDLTSLYACARFDTVEVDPGELRDLLADPDQLWDPDTWARWAMTFAVWRPRGQAVPVSADFGRGYALIVAPFDLEGGQVCHHWADLAAAHLDGADPDDLDVVRVFRLTAVGTQPGLRPVRLPTGRCVDLTCEDLGAVLIEERRAAKRAGPKHLEGLMKAVGLAFAYGLPARTDPNHTARAAKVTGYGPSGETLTPGTRIPETPGPHAFLPAAGAVCAAGRLIMALACHQIRALGGQVAAIHADSLTIPAAPRGSWVRVANAPGGRVRILSTAELRRAIKRFEALGVAFTWDVPARAGAVGVVVGVNKVIFAVPAGEDWAVIRGSDSGLGGHLADPSDQPGSRGPDGRTRWAAELERAVIAAATQPATGNDAGLRINPADLPDWAHRPVLRRFTADTRTALVAIHAEAGDPTIQPFTRYLRADGGTAAPLAIGPWPDSTTWADADFRLAGNPVSLETLGPDGHRTPLGQQRPVRVVVPSIAIYLSRWANPDDPTMTGLRRGLRHPVPVRSAPGVVVVVGRDGGELMAADADPSLGDADVRLVYGTAAGNDLRQRAKTMGLREIARGAGIPFETIREWAHGARTSPANLTAITAALRHHHTQSAGQPVRLCGLLGCEQAARPRSSWCCEAHRKAASRRAAAPKVRDPAADLPACPSCHTRFIKPQAAAFHTCKGPTP